MQGFLKVFAGFNSFIEQEGFSNVINYKNNLIYFIPFAISSAIEVDERGSLLAYKPAVAFPSKQSATGFLPKNVALGESETAEAVSTAAANETTAGGPVADTAAAEVTVEEAKITEVPPTNEVTTKNIGSEASDVEAKVQKDQDDSSSSSSSSSDSDSDSDSDDEKPKTETPETLQSEEKAAEEKKAPGLTTEQVDKKAKPEAASFGEAQESAKTVTKAKPEKVPTPSAKTDGSDETFIDPAPIVSSSTTESIPEMSSDYIKADTTDKIVDTATEVKMAHVEEIVVEKEPEIKAEDAVTDAAEVFREVFTEASPEEIVKTAVEASPEVAPEASGDVAAKPEDAVTDAAEVFPEVLTEARPEEIVKTAVEASPEVAPEASGDVAAKPEDAPSKAEAGTPATPSEELVDPAPVSADAAEALTEMDIVETPEGTPHILTPFVSLDPSHHRNTFLLPFIQH